MAGRSEGTLQEREAERSDLNSEHEAESKLEMA